MSLLVGAVFILVGIVGTISATLEHSMMGAAFFLIFAALGAGAAHGGVQILRARSLVLTGA